MKRVLVIADDLTGAAEIGGIAVRYRLATELVGDVPFNPEAACTVIDTDSRNRSGEDAAAIVKRAAEASHGAAFDLIYKKTDSVMRGPILAELEAAMEAFRRSKVLLIPQNPSRGRTIRDGQYYVDDVPLDKTAFACDPEHPAKSANVLDLLGQSNRYGTYCLAPHNDLPERGIALGEACKVDEVRQWAAHFSPVTLPAGGADFFQAILEANGLQPSRPYHVKLGSGPQLFVCGSASAYSRQLIELARAHGVPVCSEPQDVSDWIDCACRAMQRNSRALMIIDQPMDRRPGASQWLETMLAQAAAAVIHRHGNFNLLVDGGSTASALCATMGWKRFIIDGELEPGVVQMRVADDKSRQRLIVKPGSYPWPESVWQQPR